MHALDSCLGSLHLALICLPEAKDHEELHDEDSGELVLNPGIPVRRPVHEGNDFVLGEASWRDKGLLLFCHLLVCCWELEPGCELEHQTRSEIVVLVDEGEPGRHGLECPNEDGLFLLHCELHHVLEVRDCSGIVMQQLVRDVHAQEVEVVHPRNEVVGGDDSWVGF